MTPMSYRTKKSQYPGQAVLDAEFAAVATPEQIALHDAVLAAGGTWTTVEPGVGIWSIFDRTTSTDVLFFHRGTGAVEVSA